MLPLSPAERPTRDQGRRLRSPAVRGHRKCAEAHRWLKEPQSAEGRQSPRLIVETFDPNPHANGSGAPIHELADRIPHANGSGGSGFLSIVL